MRYTADIIIFKNLIFLDQPFTYTTDLDIKVGDFVVVDFNNRLEIGLVIDRDNNTKDENLELKPVYGVVEELKRLPKLYVDLGLWMREFYVLTYAKAFGTIVNISSISKLEATYSTESVDQYIIDLVDKSNSPKGLSNKEKKVLDQYIISGAIDVSVKYNVVAPDSGEVFVFNKDLSSALKEIQPNATRQWALILEIYEEYKDPGYFDWDDLYKLDNYTKGVYDQLLKKEIFSTGDIPDHSSPDVVLNTRQQEITEEIKSSDQNKFLLRGVTGSGKTEVYFDLIEDVLKRGGGSIFLVPEISLTPQIQNRIIERFGKNVAVYHSKLTTKQRITEISKIITGKAKILLGTRSAIFLPMPDLKLVIVDEEHDDSYKLDSNNKYDIREVSRYLVEQIPGAKVVLGSATPSVETYYKAEHGIYKLLELDKRYRDTAMPEVLTVDMREELKHGNNTPFSMDLMLEMKRTLSKNKQVLLFLNRRGYAPFVSCRDCGEPVVCDSCDISMVYHRGRNYLSCHYCGATKPYPRVCPNCQSTNIRHFGMGTEQLEEITKELFPDHSVHRIDSDTTSHLDEYEENIKVIEEGKVDIIIGTQMITKGLDFPDIGLVGVLAADLSLNMPDYGAAESTFQLLTQVAGRSGRSDERGMVIIQSYNPDHFSIEASSMHDYQAFYDSEIKLRNIFHYPPFIRRFVVNIIGNNPNETIYKSKQILVELEKLLRSRDLEKSTEIISSGNRLTTHKIHNRYYTELILNGRVRDESKVKRAIYDLLFKNIKKIDLKGLHVDLIIR